MVKTDKEIVDELRVWLDKKVEDYSNGQSGNWFKQETILAELIRIVGDKK